MLEVKDDGTSNTLTTVQKDNIVIEPKEEIAVALMAIFGEMKE